MRGRLRHLGHQRHNGTANSGLRIQSDGATLKPARIRVGSVNAYDCFGNGFYIYGVESCEVGQYHGYSNGQGATGSDKYCFNIDTDGRVRIGTIDSDTPGTFGGRIQGTGYCKVDAINVVSPTGTGVLLPSTGRVYIDTVRVTGAGTTYAVNVTGAAKGKIQTVECDQAHSITQSRVTVAAANYDFEIGQIRLGSTDVLEGNVTLTNAGTATDVTCGHVWRDYVGGSADYFQPVIVILPWNSSAGALGQMPL